MAGSKEVSWEVTVELGTMGLRNIGAHNQGCDVWEEGEGRSKDVQCFRNTGRW